MTLRTPRRSCLTAIGSALFAALCAGCSGSAAQSRHAGALQPTETYDAAEIDGNGDLSIVKANGQRITVRKDSGQTVFEDPLVSSAKTAVGAQAMFHNCCTSYDIPLELVVYAGGKVHRFRGVGLPIFEWGFADRGTRVAYGQTTVHFGCETHYELRDIASEHLVASADVPEPCGQNPDPKSSEKPRWVTDLISKKP